MNGAGEWLAVGLPGPAVPPKTAALAEQHGLGGVVLFARNLPTLEAVLRLTAEVRALGPDVLVLVDHEGGRVHRLPPPFTRFPPAAALGRAGDPELAGHVAGAMARELRAAGFDSGLGPVLDCLVEPRNPAIGDRAYAADPEVVAACGVAAVRAMLAEGLIPVAKHFPGHGRTTQDSHRVLPAVDVPRALLEAVDLRPFRQALAVGCPAVMVAHIRYAAFDPDRPASLSPLVVGNLLRGDLGFDGLVLSDDLEMGAIAATGGPGPGARAFVEAGGDLALLCQTTAAWQAALEALAPLAARAPERLARSRARRGALLARTRSVERPDPGVIGCAEHRALAEAVSRRGGG